MVSQFLDLLDLDVPLIVSRSMKVNSWQPSDLGRQSFMDLSPSVV